MEIELNNKKWLKFEFLLFIIYLHDHDLETQTKMLTIASVCVLYHFVFNCIPITVLRNTVLLVSEHIFLGGGVEKNIASCATFG
jgi:hypothetical protein